MMKEHARSPQQELEHRHKCADRCDGVVSGIVARRLQPPSLTSSVSQKPRNKLKRGDLGGRIKAVMITIAWVVLVVMVALTIVQANLRDK
jgi:hypothetical protein